MKLSINLNDLGCEVSIKLGIAYSYHAAITGALGQITDKCFVDINGVEIPLTTAQALEILGSERVDEIACEVEEAFDLGFQPKGD